MFGVVIDGEIRKFRRYTAACDFLDFMFPETALWGFKMTFVNRKELAYIVSHAVPSN